MTYFGLFRAPGFLLLLSTTGLGALEDPLGSSWQMRSEKNRLAVKELKFNYHNSEIISCCISHISISISPLKEPVKGHLGFPSYFKLLNSNPEKSSVSWRSDKLTSVMGPRCRIMVRTQKGTIILRTIHKQNLKGPSTQIQSIFPKTILAIPSIETMYTPYLGTLDPQG